MPPDQKIVSGNDHNPKIKSKRGGQLMFWYLKKWRGHILRGVSKQRITYDQLNLTQFIQGFAKNIFEEQNPNICESMLQYLADLMEDATDFSWTNAKVSHAVLLCEMERGSLTWSDSHKISQILTPRSITLHRSHIGPEIPSTKNHGSVNLINPTLANFLKIMRLTGKFTVTFVLTVWVKAGLWGFQRKNVHFIRSRQKISKRLLSLRAGAG